MSTVQEFLPGRSASNAGIAGEEQSCPRCSSPTIRVWRRPVDRLSAWFRPARRYRCQAFLCQWEGNVRVPRAALQKNHGLDDSAGRYGSGDPSDAPTSISRTFLLSMAFALATGAFILITAYTHWLEPGGFLVSAASPLPLLSHHC